VRLVYENEERPRPVGAPKNSSGKAEDLEMLSMKYMFLIYSQERPEGPDPTQIDDIKGRHWAVMQEAKEKGVLLAVEGLKSTVTATTVRIQDGKPITLDGPFAETKEQLAGYYILECRDLDEAIGWAARIPSSCKGTDGCIEIRPVAELPRRP
jgi:hypothetical protein